MELSCVLPTKGLCEAGVKSTASGQDKATTANTMEPMVKSANRHFQGTAAPNQ
jgi:hypothetical protein